MNYQFEFDPNQYEQFKRLNGEQQQRFIQYVKDEVKRVIERALKAMEVNDLKNREIIERHYSK